MPRLRVMSDLHLEFGPLHLEPVGEDVLVLAGDIGIYADGAFWARDYAKTHDIPVVMVAGNHEFYESRQHYTHTVSSTIAALRDIADGEPLFHFLEDDIEEVAGVLFTGCTLWTDFGLAGDPPMAMLNAAEAMNDFRLIMAEDMQRFSPEHSRQRHAFSAGVLRERLPRRYHDGRPLVVVTHHLPSVRSIAPCYSGNSMNAAFASRLDDLVEGSGAALWVHGHTHHSMDYLLGETRVLCNPRGYDGDELNPEFKIDLIVEV